MSTNANSGKFEYENALLKAELEAIKMDPGRPWRASYKVARAEARRWEWVARQLDSQLTILWEKEWPWPDMPDIDELLAKYDKEQV